MICLVSLLNLIMALYYKIKNSESPLPEIQAHQIITTPSSSGPCTKFDFSKHVLIELLDDFTPEGELWKALDLTDNKCVIHKRLMIDSHRIRCRRAIVVCSSAVEAKNLAVRVSQTKIIKRCVCAVVVQELLSDLSLFEKQILNFGDERSQHQLLYVTDLNRCREPSSLASYLKEKFSVFGSILSVFVAEDKDGYAYPEGVIKFAYLSEAFAAELAYDQLVVGMERLSVTTHHNILLTQCDLRVRLRETLRNNVSLLESNLLNSRKSTVESNQQLYEDGDSLIVCPDKFQNVNSISAVDNFNQTENPTLKNKNASSVFIKDVDNLMRSSNCSNSYDICNRRSNKTFPLSVPSVFNEISNVNYLEMNSPLKETTVTSFRGETLSSKMNRIIETGNISCLEKKSLDHSSNLNDNGVQITLDDELTSCSFVTANDVTCSTLSDRKKICHSSILSNKNTTPTNLSENLCISNSFLDSDWDKTEVTNSLSNLRKNLSSKLSLKSQRLDSRSRSSLFFKSAHQSPVVLLKRLTPMEIEKWTNAPVQPNLNDSNPLVPDALLDFEILNESPLRLWLKRELHYSSNNRVTGGCLENSKKVVYATTKQDILVSVGCSNMTCSSCYPRSTNLLFGFR